MNIQHLLRNHQPDTHDARDEKVNRLMLHQLIVYAMEGDRARFDCLLPKCHNLLEPFHVSTHYELETRQSEGNVNDVQLNETEDYTSFLHCAVSQFPTEFALKVAHSATSGTSLTFYPSQSYDKYKFLHDSELIQICLEEKKEQLLEFFLHSGFFNEQDIYKTIFIYKSVQFKTLAHSAAQDDPQALFDTWHHHAKHGVEKGFNHHHVTRALHQVFSLVDVRHYRAELSACMVPVLVQVYDSVRFISGEQTKTIKDLVCSAMVHGIVDIHTPVHQVNKEETTMAQAFKLSDKDIEVVVSQRAQMMEKELPQKPVADKPRVKL